MIRVLKTEAIGETGKPYITAYDEGTHHYWHKGYHLSEAPNEDDPELHALKSSLIKWGEEMASSSSFDVPKVDVDYEIIYRKMSDASPNYKPEVEGSLSTLAYKLCFVEK